MDKKYHGTILPADWLKIFGHNSPGWKYSLIKDVTNKPHFTNSHVIVLCPCHNTICHNISRLTWLEVLFHSNLYYNTFLNRNVTVLSNHNTLCHNTAPSFWMEMFGHNIPCQKCCLIKNVTTQRNFTNSHVIIDILKVDTKKSCDNTMCHNTSPLNWLKIPFHNNLCHNTFLNSDGTSK